MSASIIIILMVLCLLLALAIGCPLAFSLLGTAFLFGSIVWGPGVVHIFSNKFLNIMQNYTLVAVPLFVLMGSFLSASGIAERLFASLRLVMGSFRGGVAIAVITVSTLFAACTGVVAASVVTMSLLAIPTMLKFNYDSRLATGCVGAGGSLGMLIPPSIMLVMMGDQAGVSVGKLFAATIFPGLMLSLMYIGYISFICFINPKMGPPVSIEERESYSAGKKIIMVFKDVIPVIVLMFGVLGVIFLGVATPTEAAGVGAGIAFIMVIAYGRLTFQVVKNAVSQTAKVTSMALLIAAGSSCFTAIFLGVGGGNVVVGAFEGLELSKWGVFFTVMLIFFVLGCFIDWIGIVFVCFPIFLPIIEANNFNMLWFLTISAVNLQMSFLTPPFGYALFYLRGTVPPEISIVDIYKGAIPYILLIIILIFLMIFYPQTALWLPNLVISR